MRYSLLGFCLILSFRSYGFGYFDSVNKGTPLPGLSPAAAALGTARAIGLQEPACLFTNPSQTAELSTSVQLSGSMDAWTERVIVNDLETTTRTFNTYKGITTAFIIPAGGVTLGAGFARVAEFGYEGAQTVWLQPDDPELGVAVLYADGGQYEAMGSVATKIAGTLSMGISAGIRSASADYEYYFNSHTFGVPDSSAIWSVDSTEFAWHAGLSMGGELFKSGFSYSSETEYMEDVVAMGISAFAAHLNNITVGFEGEVTSPFKENRFLGKLSIIMPLRDNLNALTSVSFDDQRVANRAGFGFGLGFSLNLNRIDLSAGIISRFKARKDSAFPDETSDRIDDAVSQFSFGVLYRFGD